MKGDNGKGGRTRKGRDGVGRKGERTSEEIRVEKGMKESRRGKNEQGNGREERKLVKGGM